jgi:hypothetical protein
MGSQSGRSGAEPRENARSLTIIWDIEDDPEGNVQHIQEHGLTREEAKEVLLDPNSSRGKG